MTGTHAELLTEEVQYPRERLVPFTREECALVSGEVNRFLETLLDYPSGSSRFLPWLAAQPDSDLGHDEGERSLSADDRRRFLAANLALARYLQMYRLENIEHPETIDEILENQENDFTGKRGKQYADQFEFASYNLQVELEKHLREFGLLEAEHLTAVRPLLMHSGWSPLTKQKVEVLDWRGKERVRAWGRYLYNIQWGMLEFYFLWERGGLKLAAIYCGD